MCTLLALGASGLRRQAKRQTGEVKGYAAQQCGVKGGSGDDGGIKPMIVNGQDAEECEWGWQVGLRSAGASGLPWCGGMLIHPEWVLTAAHCLEGEAAASIDVVAGDWSASNISGKEQVRTSSSIISHPHYNSWNTRNDFGLVQLQSPMELNACVSTVCLPSKGEEVAPGAQCWITGWGTLESSGAQPDILQEAEVRTLSNRDCFGQFGYSFSDIHSSMLCAQGINGNGDITDACQGDSGGPLVCETNPGVFTLHGATSWGMGCADKEYPGIWARVEQALEWIEQVQAGNTEFVPTKPPGPQCPDFALTSKPDGNGDCICPPHRYCSADGGDNYNCPLFDDNRFNPLARNLFEYDCVDCQCFAYSVPTFFR